MGMNSRFKNEDEQIVRLFDTISTTLAFVSQGFSYYQGYTFGDLTKDEWAEAENEVTRFHRMSAQFFLVVQFCKLFENYKGDKEGASNLANLNRRLKEKYKEDYVGYDDARRLISNVRATKIFCYLLELRNKAYGHSEINELNLPLKFIFLKKEELNSFKSILTSTIDAFNHCYRFYNTGTDFHNFYNSSTPKNYLKNYAKMRKLWRAHHGRNLRNDKPNKEAIL